MALRPTIQERAYQLAAEFASINGVRQQLVREGYEQVDNHLSAPSLRRALKRLCRAGCQNAVT